MTSRSSPLIRLRSPTGSAGRAAQQLSNDHLRDTKGTEKKTFNNFHIIALKTLGTGQRRYDSKNPNPYRRRPASSVFEGEIGYGLLYNFILILTIDLIDRPIISQQ